MNLSRLVEDTDPTPHDDDGFWFTFNILTSIILSSLIKNSQIDRPSALRQITRMKEEVSESATWVSIPLARRSLGLGEGFNIQHPMSDWSKIQIATCQRRLIVGLGLEYLTTNDRNSKSLILYQILKQWSISWTGGGWIWSRYYSNRFQRQAGAYYHALISLDYFTR